MILLAPLLFQVAPALSEIGRQALPASGCAAYLWQSGDPPRFVAMAQAGTLRVGLDGKQVTLVRTAIRGDEKLGLATSTDYSGEGITATLDMVIAPQPDLADGARIPQATLSITRGGDAAIVPLAGLAACARPMR